MNNDVITLTTVPTQTNHIKLNDDESKLLENYAGLAMQAIITKIESLKNNEDYNHDAVAFDAFEFAFAMMRRRNQYNSKD
jgi:hypothetical protein